MEFTEIASIVITYANPVLAAAITAFSGATIPLVSKYLRVELDSTEKRLVVIVSGFILTGLLAFIQPQLFPTTKDFVAIALASSIASLGGYASFKNAVQSKKVETIADNGTINT